MKVIRKILVPAIILLVICMSVPSYAAQTVKIALSINPDMSDPCYVMAVVFKNYVETRTGGRYAVEIYPSNVIGKERERLELVKANGIQINVGSIGGLSNIYKPAILLNTPFMYSGDKVVHEVLESNFVKWLFDDMYKKTGIRSVMVFDIGGLSCFTNNVRPVASVADMKGIKFRAMDDSQVEMFRALGANAVPMAFAELYTGLQTGVVEGQVNPINITISSKFFEVQKYITISRTILGSQWVTVNEKWYESLPPADRKIFDDAFHYGNIAAKGQRLTTFAPLLALDARLEIRTPLEAHWVPMNRYFSNTGREPPKEPEFISKIRVPSEAWDISVFRRIGPPGTITDLTASFVFLVKAQKNLLLDIRIAWAGKFFFRKREFENLMIGRGLPLTEKDVQSLMDKADGFFDKNLFPPSYERQCLFNLLEDSLRLLT